MIIKIKGRVKGINPSQSKPPLHITPGGRADVPQMVCHAAESWEGAESKKKKKKAASRSQEYHFFFKKKKYFKIILILSCISVPTHERCKDNKRVTQIRSALGRVFAQGREERREAVTPYGREIEGFQGFPPFLVGASGSRRRRSEGPLSGCVLFPPLITQLQTLRAALAVGAVRYFPLDG